MSNNHSSTDGNSKGRKHVEKKTWSSRPVHPSTPTAASKGQGVLKGESLCPPKGPFGVGPTKCGHTNDESNVVHLGVFSTGADVSNLSSTPSLEVHTGHRIFIDSGATDSISPLRQAMIEFVPSKIQITLAAQGMQSRANGRGTMLFRFEGKQETVYKRIHGVIYDPNARDTLLSTASLQDVGITITFPADTSYCVLMDRNGKEVCRGKRHAGKLYVMPISLVYPGSNLYSAKCLSAQTFASLHHALAHLRLGHVNDRDLESLVRAQRLKDIALDDLKEALFCYGCKMGKAANLPYTQPPRDKVTKPGGRVHVDVWGPIKVAGLKGERYMIVLVDEASQFITVKLMKARGEAAQHIKDYRAMMEKQHEQFELRILHSDNAREILTSKDMQMWMQKSGIVSELSPPYTPQLNGKAERAMRTLMEPVRSILAMAKLPLRLWSELVLAIAHTKNRLPSRAIKGQIPFEVLTGRKAKLEHLRVLGCDAYALHKAPGRNKLQEKADHYLLVGYGDTTGTYRVYDPMKRIILITRDVVFNEEGFIKRTYLPYQDHFGMGDDIEGGDLVPPANKIIKHRPTS